MNRVKWRQKLLHEFTEYWINVAYMALFFSAVVLYRRLVLAEHGIVLEDYFAGVIKALVIAKVVMIGAFLRISRKFEHKPLVIPTFYKAVLFTIWVMLFDIAEIFAKGLVQTRGVGDALGILTERINAAWFGAALLVFISFLPFFAMKEVSRTIGSAEFRGLFFNNRKHDGL
jgi:hypothetical protein